MQFPKTKISLFLSLLLALSIFSVWSNSYQSPLVFDDLGSIRDNATIRPPYSLEPLFNPPSEGAQTVAGRPLLNLSLAANYYFSGENYSTYRVTNVMIHLANALLVFALATQLLRLASFDEDVRTANWLPFFISLVWALHPISTTAVSYLVQRAESLTALFLLLTLYCFSRSLDSKRPIAWLAVSLVAAFVGSACKETMVATPFLVALIAWSFGQNPDRQAPTRNFQLSIYFGLLFLSILPTILLSQATGDRAETASMSIGIQSLDYLKLQSWAILRYLQLAVWPAGQVFDYGRDIAIPSTLAWMGYGFLIVLGLAFSVYLFLKRRKIAFIALAPFILLAPSSSVFPLADPIFEHRFYLSLACIVALLCLGLHKLSAKATLVLLPIIATLLGLTSHERNKTYQSAIELWQSSLDYSPINARAQTNLGTLLLAEGNYDAAIEHLSKAIEIRTTPLRLHNLANAYALNGQTEIAIPLYTDALISEPNFPAAILGLAEANLAAGDFPAAMESFRKFLEESPDNIPALRGYVRSSLATKDLETAIEAFQRICELSPQNANAYFDLGDTLAQAAQFEKAKSAFLRAIEIEPQHAQALSNLGNLYLMQREYAKATKSYQDAIRIEPNAMSHTNLAISLIYQRRIQEAKTHLESAIELDSNYPPARDLLHKLNSR
ncbi:tetratricopeptide repeat protein [Pelagicoccus sp. SDUM812002]|uniref:tetratricopeptide repeat protein n=1 Tax=Pelagicoccus sp. SDUM812002 TaxID=3041266 RepID=UPI00280FCF83|nr:tetratricopeptide repeat protein [Pelagicoccus sp. SDUM812002]MDQ8184035.1 tetratricopeptide repeat protein [Pelagicoccus sp. SDUM812002]